MSSARIAVLVAALAGCGPEAGGTADGETTSAADAGTSPPTTTTDVSASSSSGASASASTSTTSTTIAETGEASSSSGGMKLDLPGCPPLSCGGTVYACTDGDDNDSDGLVDLADPECTSPCDDDEGSFQAEASIPGDSFIGGCIADCLFDGNSGQGDDGCINHLRCDPEDPGGVIGCGYSANNQNCPNDPPEQSPECAAFCEPFVLPGCDCFSCCTFMTEDGPVDLFLEGSFDCSLDNLEACQPCTSQIGSCGNVCTPETCEICIGEAAPPERCATNVCDNGNACATTADCACGEGCLLGCCIPPPPG